MKESKSRKSQHGAMMIVEASFVFPIMFFVIFIMLMAGSAFFQQARIERILEEYAIEAAACSENPMIEEIYSHGGSVPTSTRDNEIMPYRYLFTGHTKKVRSRMERKINEAISGYGSLGFVGMNAKLDESARLTVQPHILVPSLVADCSFHVDFPIRIIFSKEPLRYRVHVRVREPIGDATEFVRNVSTVQDYLERNKAVMDIAQEIGNSMNKIGAITN